jgi:hypothetical protein
MILVTVAASVVREVTHVPTISQVQYVLSNPLLNIVRRKE